MTEPAEHQRIAEVFEYDPEKGIVAAYNEYTRTEYEIRAGVLDRVTRFAVIAELEKLGYTVISPEAEEPSDES